MFDLSQNVKILTLDDVPENFHSVYVEVSEEDGGGFKINPTHKGIVEALIGANNANVNIRKENKTLLGKQVDMAPLIDFGATPAEIKEAIDAKIEEMTQELAKGDESKLNLDKIRQELKDAHAKDLLTRDKEATSLRQTLHKYLITTDSISAIVAEKGAPDLLLPHIERQAKVVADGESFRVRIVDKDGDPRISVATGEPMTIQELVVEMKNSDTFARAFDSESSSGGGKLPEKLPPLQKTILNNQENGDERKPVDKIKAGLDARQKGK